MDGEGGGKKGGGGWRMHVTVRGGRMTASPAVTAVTAVQWRGGCSDLTP